METNANNPTQRNLANKFIDALGEEADFFEGEVLFHEGGVLVIDNEGEVQEYETEEKFAEEFSGEAQAGDAGEENAADKGAISGQGVAVDGRSEATEVTPDSNPAEAEADDDGDPFADLLGEEDVGEPDGEAAAQGGAGEGDDGDDDDPFDMSDLDLDDEEGSDEAASEGAEQGSEGDEEAEEEEGDEEDGQEEGGGSGGDDAEDEEDEDEASDSEDGDGSDGGGDDSDSEDDDDEDEDQEAEEEQPNEEIDEELNEIIKALTADVTSQIRGELDQNSARWRKGGRLTDLANLKAKLAKAGDSILSRGNALMNYAQELVDSELQSNGIVSDSDVNREGAHTGWGSPSERSFTTKAFKTFMHDGLDSTFRLVDQLDPRTGDPLVGDDGESYEKPVSSIALNKAYRLAGLVGKNGKNRDRLLSFAWAYDEKSCVGLAKLVKEGYKLDKLLDDIAAGRTTIEDEESAEEGTTIEVQWDSSKVKEFLTSKKANATGGVRSIKIDSALYEGDWTDIRRTATRLFTGLGQSDMLDEKGEARATKLLETIFDAVAPRNHGATVIADLFLAAGDITQQQRDQFVKFYSYGDNANSEAAFDPDADVGDVTTDDVDLD